MRKGGSVYSLWVTTMPVPVGRETPVSFSKNTGYLQFIISCQQSDVLKTVSIKLPYAVIATVTRQYVNQNQRDGNLLSDSKFVGHHGVFFCFVFVFLVFPKPSPKRVLKATTSEAA